MPQRGGGGISLLEKHKPRTLELKLTRWSDGLQICFVGITNGYGETVSNCEKNILTWTLGLQGWMDSWLGVWTALPEEQSSI